MRKFYLWILWIWYGISFPITISNIQDLMLRHFDKELILSMELSSLNFITEDILENMQIGLMINGKLCHLYHEKWYYVHIFLPNHCVTEKSFWFSLYLEIPITDLVKKYAVSLPIFVPSLDQIHTISELNVSSKVTLVLPLAFDDISRAYLLLNSLRQLSNETIQELIILSPDQEYLHIANLLSFFRDLLAFPLRILPDSAILPPIPASRNVYPYAVQMALKILVSSIVSTSTYITLDSDLLLIHSFNLSTIMSRDEGYSRVLYEYEPRDHHAAWWDGSQKFLSIPENYFSISEKSSQAFSVTPAVLTVYGSLLLLNRIHQNFVDRHSARESSYNESIVDWILSLGVGEVVWSEYTMYRIILDYYHIFEDLHFLPENDSYHLHCCNIWYPSDIPNWSYQNSLLTNCLFNVIQSSSGVRPSLILKAIQPS